MRGVLKITYCLFLIMVMSNPAYAQAEFPDVAKQAMQKGIDTVDKATTLEDLDAAINYFEQALAAAPKWPDACYNLASVLAMKTGREEEAIKRFNQYLEFQPQAPDAADVRAEIRKVEARLELLRNKDFMLQYLEFASLPDGIYVVGWSKPSRMGFRRGDKILTINGKPTKGMTLAELYTIMKEGPAEEFVCFNYVRPSNNVPGVYGYKREALFNPEAPRRMTGRKNASGGYTNCIGGQSCCE